MRFHHQHRQHFIELYFGIVFHLKINLVDLNRAKGREQRRENNKWITTS
jgi:hypothetical protein